MKQCEGHPFASSLILEDPSRSENLQKIISKNSDQFFSYINTLGLHVKNAEEDSNGQSTFTTMVALKPTCFTVEFNDNLVKMSPLK